LTVVTTEATLTTLSRIEDLKGDQQRNAAGRFGELQENGDLFQTQKGNDHEEEVKRALPRLRQSKK